MVYQPKNNFPNPNLPNGGNGFGPGWPPWWYVLGAYDGGTSAAAVARDVDSFLVPLLPTERTARLLDEIDALAVVDPAVRHFCELIAEELQPVLDEDEDGTLVQLLWANAQELLTSPSVRIGVRQLLRSGPALVGICQWQLKGRMRAEVLRAARDEVRNRRRLDSALDTRLRGAADELAVALPQQKGPLVVAGIIVLETGALAYLATELYHLETGHYIGEVFH